MSIFPRLTPSKPRLLVLALLLAALIAGCNPPVAISATPTTAGLAQQPTATPAPLPTATSDPSRAVLVAPPGSEARAQAIQALLQEAAAGLQVVTLPEAAPADLTAGVKLVVLLDPPQNLDQLLGAAPQAQFVVISSIDIPAQAANLSVIRVRPENQAFLAGYIAELVSTDWRAAGLLPDETLSNAFLAGGRYWCGRCTPIYPPVVIFPLTGVLPDGSGVAEWQSALAALQQKVLEVVYLSPEATSSDLINFLVDQQLRIVGSLPPPVEATAQWVASVQVDELASLRSLLPDLLAGQGGKQVNAALSVSNVNSAILSTGRLRLVQETQKALEDGLINALPVP